jgi:hypothetical protein
MSFSALDSDRRLLMDSTEQRRNHLAGQWVILNLTHKKATYLMHYFSFFPSNGNDCSRLPAANAYDPRHAQSQATK